MSLKDYKGPANHPDLIRSLVGERIKGVMFESGGAVMLVFDDGTAITLVSTGGGAPAYWKVCPKEVAELVAIRQKELLANQAALADLVVLMPPDGAT